MKQVSITLCLFLCSVQGFAQQYPSNPALKTYEKIEMGLNGMGLAVETPLSQNILSEFYLGVGPSYDIHDDISITHSLNWNWALLEPSIHASIYGKYYYNRNKRWDKHKSTWLNSGNFIGLKIKYVSKSLSEPQYYSNTILTNMSWGLQRNLGKHWTYSFATGLAYGYNIDEPYGLLYPTFDFKFSYILPFFDKGK